ncbi:hypothetical protein AFERRI_10002 [Acidithiobacillus ferrivorans]|uniref:Uncharacterized protein n=1 Tax=Acidithiobacillus ferrivorans TaxID=160808 RepID=A0A060UYX5_9PROT|nr:hypothetical protein AFERRI_580012 [Acidithiobacillus ferrivorans]CDQ12017.1 hypothetical protein AFERRI_10002 [Acidithiobacillus ferrivorans]
MGDGRAETHWTDTDYLRSAILNMKLVGLPNLSGQIFDRLLGVLPQLLLCVGS